MPPPVVRSGKVLRVGETPALVTQRVIICANAVDGVALQILYSARFPCIAPAGAP